MDSLYSLGLPTVRYACFPCPVLACTAVSSALNDRRFAPIEMSELASLDVSVSLLVKYEPAQHWEDWEVWDDVPNCCVVRWSSVVGYDKPRLLKFKNELLTAPTLRVYRFDQSGVAKRPPLIYLAGEWLGVDAQHPFSV